jgi:hypothetical protein
VQSAQDRYHDHGAEEQRADGAADHERESMAGESPELTALGFDLAADGDADERDEDQRAGGGKSSATQGFLSAQPGFDASADGAHVGLAGGFRFHDAHDLAHILDGRGAGRGNRLADDGVELGVGKLRGQIGL